MWSNPRPNTYVFMNSMGAPIASVIGTNQGQAYLTMTTPSGSTQRATFSSVQDAKVFVANVLNRSNPAPTTPIPTPPVVAITPVGGQGGGASQPAPPPKPKLDKKQLAANLVSALSMHPDIAWDVVNNLRVLGPWTPNGMSYMRQDVRGHIVGRCLCSSEGCYDYQILIPEERTYNSTEDQPSFVCWEDARKACDAHLASLDYLLAP